MHVFLFWQFTNGIYYKLDKNKGDCGKAIGNAFEEYVGRLLKKTLTNESIYHLREFIYGGKKKNYKTSDWILWDNSEVMLVECKMKRPTLPTYTMLAEEEHLVKDLNDLAHAIRQLYTQYLKIVTGEVERLHHLASKRFNLVVLTSENWWLNRNLDLYERLKKQLIVKFKEKNMDPSLIQQIPFVILSSSEFEMDIQLIDKFGIKFYFDHYRNGSLKENTKGFKYSDPFDSDYIKELIEPVRNLNR